MNHLSLEYSGNIKIEDDDLKILFSQLQEVLAEGADAKLFRFQSKPIFCENFSVGDGRKNRAFVYLQEILLERRLPNRLQETGKQLLEILQTDPINSIIMKNKDLKY